MRRLILEEPYSTTALLSWRLATFSAAVAIVAVVVSRGGLDAVATLAVLGGAVAIAATAVATALVAFVVIWRSGRKGAGAAAAGLLLAILISAYPAYLVQKAVRFPRLVDLSTDLVDPPAFSLARQALAARGGVTPPYVSARMRMRQLKAYPEIQPILLDLDAPEAYRSILKAVAASGWRIVEQIPPGGRSGLGHIDAIARSAILGFPCDVTLRIRPLVGQTRVDFRSVSRFALSDFGANQRNEQKFEAALTAEVDKTDQAGR